jgi:acyl-CoA dehydrogenase
MLDVDRLQIAALALGASELAFELTVNFARERQVFGQRLIDMQNTQFKLAELRADLVVGRAFLKDCVEKFAEGSISSVDTATAKYWFTEMEGRVMDACLQLHGGAGFMDDMPISRLYTAARVHRIYIGTSEIMKLIIGRSLS